MLDNLVGEANLKKIDSIPILGKFMVRYICFAVEKGKRTFEQ